MTTELSADTAEAEFSLSAVEVGLGRYLTDKWCEQVRVEQLRLIPGGAARGTWRCLAITPKTEHGLIVRIDTGTKLGLSDDVAEFLVTQVAYRAGLPVPEPLFFEQDVRWIGYGFSLTREIPNCRTALDGVVPAVRMVIAKQKWEILGRIASLDPIEAGLGDILPEATAEDCAASQVAHWYSVLLLNEVHPSPVAHAAARWLNRHLPPPPSSLVLVHGDYRTGNFLFAEGGTIEAILDWEMAHLGDPLEDLAWSLDLRQAVGEPHLAGSLIPHDEAIAIWSRASGIRVDPAALRWWQVFAAFKALAIWTLSARTFLESEAKRPIMARIGWLLSDRQQQILQDYLSPHSDHRFFEYRP